MVSYEIPLGLALLCVILMAGTVRADEIVAAQMGAGNQWFILHQPLAAILFYVCMLAESNRAPFDLAEAEAELVGGWHTEYSSMKWALFFLGEYIGMVVGGAFFVTLFLGGWSLNPIGIGPDITTVASVSGLGWIGAKGLIRLQFGIVLGKVVANVFLTRMIRWTLPRFRFDQLMRLSWEGMIPAGLVLLVVTSFCVYMGGAGVWMWAASLATLTIFWFSLPLLPRQASPNRRVPLIGSRFNPLHEHDVVTRPTDPRALVEITTGER
jgi:NADH-quinone oxidoreductase subunit H